MQNEARMQPRDTKPTVATNVTSAVKALRIELDRMIQDLRVKTKGASAEARHTLDVLDEEVKRFGGEVANASEETRADLEKVGADLRARVQKLVNQIALPS